MFIEFCEGCQNQMYIKWNKEDLDTGESISLILYCKKCGNTKSLTQNDFYDIDRKEELELKKKSQELSKEEEDEYENILQLRDPVILENVYTTNDVDSKYYNNEYICDDVTLPLINDDNVKCPECIVKTDIIYQIYDQDNMKFLYTCCNCKKSWHN